MSAKMKLLNTNSCNKKVQAEKQLKQIGIGVYFVKKKKRRHSSHKGEESEEKYYNQQSYINLFLFDLLV